METGDSVYLAKRGIFGNEWMDNSTHLSKNKPYIIERFINECVKLYGEVGTYNEKHFKKWNIIDGKIRGINFFKKGDSVELVERGKMGWEPKDFTIDFMLETNKVYKVAYYVFNGTNSYIEISGRAYYPNHFKKV